MTGIYHAFFGTLRRQLIFGVAAVHAVMMTFFIYDLTQKQRAFILDRQTEHATALAHTMATSAAGWLAAQDISGLQELADAQRRYPDLVYAMLLDNRGQVLAHTDRSRLNLYVLDLPGETRETVLGRSKALVDVAVPAILVNSHVGWARVGIGQRLAGQKLTEITRNGEFYAIGAIVLGSLLALLVGKRITRRLKRIQSVMDEVRLGNHQARSDLTGDDEAAGMANIFNLMLDMLGQHEHELRRNEEEIRKLNRELDQRVRERTALLESANKELESFAYSVSHDLRAPLRSIDGFSQILLDDHAAQLDEEGKQCLQRVRVAAQRMAQLIDDMLSLSRLSRGEMQMEELSLSNLAQEIAHNLSRNEPERNVVFVIVPDLVVAGDARFLRIALENLLGNSWKFTSKRQEAKIEFGVTDQEGRRVYFVRDNGAGFDMKHAGRLFSAFQRLHSTDEFPGTGIGLATVQRIIHRHGGRIWVQGEVNQGATFYFSLH